MNKENIFYPYLSYIDLQQDKMVKDLIKLANINSSTFNAAGIEKVCYILKQLSEPLTGRSSIISYKPYNMVNMKGSLEKIVIGPAFSMKKRENAPFQVFLLCHADTVYAKESGFDKVIPLNSKILNGPGVADAKGGIIVMFNALYALEKSPWAKNIGWEILITPDEEIGSPVSASLIDKLAKKKDIGFIFEPSFEDGALASLRYGSGNFTAVIFGHGAHAGRNFNEGRNAVSALKDFIFLIEKIGKKGINVNPAIIMGGSTVNTVPDKAVLKFNIRIKSYEDQTYVYKKLEQAIKKINNRDGFFIKLFGGFNRQPKSLTESTKKLLAFIKECGSEIGMDIKWRKTGGCCDGNNLSQAKLLNIDNLGVKGGAIHSRDEYVEIDSLTKRTKLCALVLMKIAKNKLNSWSD